MGAQPVGKIAEVPHFSQMHAEFEEAVRVKGQEGAIMPLARA